jgi:hypothetical protein
MLTISIELLQLSRGIWRAGVGKVIDLICYREFLTINAVTTPSMEAKEAAFIL